MQYWNGIFFEGMRLKELLEKGYPRDSGKTAWYLTHSCYALRSFLDRPEPEVQKICKKSLRQIAENSVALLTQWRDYTPGRTFDPDWRKMLRAWRAHTSCTEAAALACGEMASLWHWKISPAVGEEKKTILDSCAAMWLILISREKDLIEPALKGLREAASAIPWSRLHYAGLFFAENAVWEWKAYQTLSL